MTKLASVFAAVCTFIMGIFAPMNTAKAPADSSDFVPTVRFLAVSDSHLSIVGLQRYGRLQKAITFAYSDAEQDENYKKLDAVMVSGDLTDDGRKSQFVSFKSVTDTVIKDGTQLLAVLAKSHDSYQMDSGARDYFTQLTGLPADFHYVINGFHFIGLSRSQTEGEQYTEDQREWLKEQLDEAVADDPAKPVFVTHHEHVKDTVYGSREEDHWGNDYFRDIFMQYPQVVHISGHSHYPLNDPRSIWQGEFTAIGTGSLNYAEFTVDGEYKIHPENYRNMAQGWIIEADAQNRVRMRGFDFLTGTLQCEYIIDAPADVQSRQFTPAQQEARCSAPEFPEGAELKAVKGIGKVSLTVPAAKSTDDYDVFLYRAVVTSADGTEKASEYKLNNYWQSEVYDSVKISVSADKGDTVSVYAENAYGARSEALVYTVG